MIVLNTLLLVASGKTVYIYPFIGYGENIFNCEDELNEPFYELKTRLCQMGYACKTTNLSTPLEDFAGLIVFHRPNQDMLNMLSKYPREKQVLILMEPPTVEPSYYDRAYHAHFGKVLIMIDDYVDNKTYFKFYFPQAYLWMEPVVPFSQKKFLTLIAGNKYSPHPSQLYSKRREAIIFFEKNEPDNFDLYGRGWGKEEFHSYKGSLNIKKESLKKYKFCICYENMKDVNGYITEKIFDAFKAGSVPVYWGASNITNFVPGDCFIDRRTFSSYEALHAFLKSMPEETYNQYLQNIRNFLASEQAYPFSAPFFVESIIQHFQLKNAQFE